MVRKAEDRAEGKLEGARRATRMCKAGVSRLNTFEPSLGSSPIFHARNESYGSRELEALFDEDAKLFEEHDSADRSREGQIQRYVGSKPGSRVEYESPCVGAGGCVNKHKEAKTSPTLDGSALTKCQFVNLLLDIAYLGDVNNNDGLPDIYDRVPRMYRGVSHLHPSD
eukprot:6206107-Pleurochrysis_carterae.AAC.1